MNDKGVAVTAFVWKGKDYRLRSLGVTLSFRYRATACQFFFCSRFGILTPQTFFVSLFFFFFPYNEPLLCSYSHIHLVSWLILFFLLFSGKPCANSYSMHQWCDESNVWRELYAGMFILLAHLLSLSVFCFKATESTFHSSPGSLVQFSC